jgi:hypothetical protein
MTQAPRQTTTAILRIAAPIRWRFHHNSPLIKTMESYTNGGLILIKEKLEENPNYFLQPTSFLNMILETEKV